MVLGEFEGENQGQKINCEEGIRDSGFEKCKEEMPHGGMLVCHSENIQRLCAELESAVSISDRHLTYWRSQWQWIIIIWRICFI
jgi:hypothetical protein